MTDRGEAAIYRLAEHQAETARILRQALARVGAMAQLRVESRSLRHPPASAAEGSCFAVPRGARGGWAGRGGMLALRLDGGWDWLRPAAGWRAWVVDEALGVVHDGRGWRGEALAVSPGGAATILRIEEEVVTLRPCARQALALRPPAQACLLGVTACVEETLHGSLRSWRIGLGSRPGLFATSEVLVAGTRVVGMVPSPLCPARGDRLMLSAEGGLFTAGRVRIAVHRLDLVAPLLGATRDVVQSLPGDPAPVEASARAPGAVPE